MALEEAGRGTDLEAHILTSLGDVAADVWDACVPGQHPFVRHAFLSALEESGSATAETGWEFAVIYRTESEGPFNLCPEEIDEGRWFSPKEIDDALATEPEKYSPTFRLIWERR